MARYVSRLVPLSRRFTMPISSSYGHRKGMQISGLLAVERPLIVLVLVPCRGR